MYESLALKASLSHSFGISPGSVILAPQARHIMDYAQHFLVLPIEKPTHNTASVPFFYTYLQNVLQLHKFFFINRHLLQCFV